jgi:serine/threonine-protein kinase
MLAVPDVVGMSDTDAVAAFKSVGLQVRLWTYQQDPSLPTGQIISTNPIGGTAVEPGSTVDCVVAYGGP